MMMQKRRKSFKLSQFQMKIKMVLMILEDLQFPKKHLRMKIKVNYFKNNNIYILATEYKTKPKDEEKKKQKPK